VALHACVAARRDAARLLLAAGRAAIDQQLLPPCRAHSSKPAAKPGRAAAECWDRQAMIMIMILLVWQPIGWISYKQSM